MLDNANQFLDGFGPIACVTDSVHWAYMKIPADSIRVFFDKSFPDFAVNTLADSASGAGHRWKAGHDLLIDIPKTLMEHGPGAAVKQTGHILFTDLPTKAGVPIAGLSEAGLGKFLHETCGISISKMCVNIMDIADTGLSILAVGEGLGDVVNVFCQETRMTPQLFWDTFGEGALEIATGCATGNPLLQIAGWSQFAAGVKITYDTITKPLWFVNPFDFFGGVLTGGLISFAVSKFILKKKNDDVMKDVAKSCAIGGAYAAGISFGIAVSIGLAACGVGKLMADQTNKKLIAAYKISEEELELFRLNASDILSSVEDFPVPMLSEFSEDFGGNMLDDPSLKAPLLLFG